MRNAKRFLALVLSVLMLAGCFTVLAGATVVSNSPFADVEEYSDAINLLTALNVIKGKSEDEYGPADNVSRGQMAIFLARATSGWVSEDNAEDQLIWKKDYTTSTFTDLTVDDYMGAIDYCFGFGYILGRSATTFDPKNTVTFQEALTMCIRALGFDTEKLQAGYPWTYIQEAIDLGLDEDLEDVAYDKPLNRAETAQLMMNFVLCPQRVNPTAYRLTAEHSIATLPSFAVDKLNYHSAVVTLGKAYTDGNKKFVKVYTASNSYAIDYDRACELFCDVDPETGAYADYDDIINAGTRYEIGIVNDNGFDSTDVLFPILAKEIGVKTVYQNAYDFALGEAFAEKNITVDPDDGKLIINDGETTTTYIYRYSASDLDYNKVNVYDSAALNGGYAYNRLTAPQIDGWKDRIADYLYKADCYDTDDDGDYEDIVLFFSNASTAKVNSIKSYMNAPFSERDTAVLNEDLDNLPISLNSRVEFYRDALKDAFIVIRGVEYNSEKSKYVVNSKEVDDFYKAETKITGVLYSFDPADGTFTVKVTKIDREEVAEPFFAEFNYNPAVISASTLRDNLSDSIYFNVFTNRIATTQVAKVVASSVKVDTDYYYVTNIGCDLNAADYADAQTKHSKINYSVDLLGIDAETGAVTETKSFIYKVEQWKNNAWETVKKDLVNGLSNETLYIEKDVYGYAGIVDSYAIGDRVFVVEGKDNDDKAIKALAILQAASPAFEDDAAKDILDAIADCTDDKFDMKADFADLNTYKTAMTTLSEDDIIEIDGDEATIGKKSYYFADGCKILLNNDGEYSVIALDGVVSIENNKYCDTLAYLKDVDDEIVAIYVECVGGNKDRANRVIDDGKYEKAEIVTIYKISTASTSEWTGDAYIFDGVFDLAFGGLVDGVEFTTKYKRGDVIALYDDGKYIKLNAEKPEDVKNTIKVTASKGNENVTYDDCNYEDVYDVELEDLDGIFQFDGTDADPVALSSIANGEYWAVYEAGENTLNILAK